MQPAATLLARADQESAPIVAILPDLAGVAKWHDSMGDTADPFWADDDQLYHFMCDGRGFGTEKRNLCFNKLSGTDLASLKGELVNSMDEYGKSNETGKDGATWKVTGQECIDGVFYAFVNRNRYGNHSKDPLLRQTSTDTSLIKSTDRGLTWTRSARENYDNPMWPGSRFGAPAFIHYGRNGGDVEQDAADKFVYAVSNNGFWNGGDDLILARVPRSKLPGMNPSDWEYFIGGDGMNPASWSTDISQAFKILERPAKLGWSAPVFIPALKRYLLVSWFISPTLKAWFAPERITYDFFEAPHPWGPWTMVGSFDDRFLGGSHMYQPNFCAKYQEIVPDGVKVQLFTSGCPFPDTPGSLYKSWRIPVVARTKPLPGFSEVNDTDPSIAFSKHWIVLAPGNSRDLNGDIHYTRSDGATVDYRFTGTGIEVLANKYRDSGEIEVFVDGKSRGLVSLKLENFPRLVQTPVFRIEGLPAGEHSLQIVVRGTGAVAIDGFRVLN